MIRLSELAGLVGAECAMPAADREISGVASLVEASPGDISFFHNARYVNQLARTQAAAVLVPADLDTTALPAGPAYLAVANPSMAFAAVVARFTPPAPALRMGVHPRAVVEEGARLDPELVSIGPGAVICAGASVGNGSVIGANVFIGSGTSIGADCHIYAGVAVRENCRIGNRVIIHGGAQIGQDGFGFVGGGRGPERIPQIGRVIIQDDVEIGANTTVDRGAMADTVIGEGTKIDNLVMIGHNGRIGRHNAFASQVGLAGSVTTGDYVRMAGQVGIADHVHIGQAAVVGAKAGVHNDLAGNQSYLGAPARPEGEAIRILMTQTKLPEMRKQLRELEQQVAALQKQLQAPSPSRMAS